MSRLEKVYLMNVILYMDSLKTLYMFIRISKSTFESMQMLHINPFYSSQTIKKEIELFSKEAQLQTIRTDDLNLPCLNSVKQIEAYNIFLSHSIPKYADKINSLTCFPNSFKNYSSCCNLKKIVCKLGAPYEYGTYFLSDHLKVLTSIPLIQTITFDLRCFSGERLNFKSSFKGELINDIQTIYSKKTNSKGKQIHFYFIGDWSTLPLNILKSIIYENVTFVSTVSINDERVLLYGNAVNNWKYEGIESHVLNCNKYYSQNVSISSQTFSKIHYDEIDLSKCQLHTLSINSINTNFIFPTTLTSLELIAFPRNIEDISFIPLLNLSLRSSKLPLHLPSSLTSLSLETISFGNNKWPEQIKNLKKLTINSVAIGNIFDSTEYFNNLNELSLVGIKIGYLQLNNFNNLSIVTLNSCHIETLELPFCINTLTLSYNAPNSIKGHKENQLILTQKKLKSVSKGVVTFHFKNTSKEKQTVDVESPKNCQIV
ncbi:Uncharacterized protein QTN25_010217 [Entamoeba marina]